MGVAGENVIAECHGTARSKGAVGTKSRNARLVAGSRRAVIAPASNGQRVALSASASTFKVSNQATLWQKVGKGELPPPKAVHSHPTAPQAHSTARQWPVCRAGAW
ncbi:hypothetical protein CATMQ487_28150 [Sphaerotilus microaerophilus]|uniref:Uncharacterized protein n=1 Tax=Sphaerotilus microaerophilus TaxID=2914710 RepID=A0ABM7YMZ3_9BURK|nr:hypothetical protein CATMQ487_28150 [Sphaerotilus sp. FB-5]